MDGCSSVSQFWIALPATIGAFGALIAALRNGRKADTIATSVDGHMSALTAKADAYGAVIQDLHQRLADEPPEV